MKGLAIDACRPLYLLQQLLHFADAAYWSQCSDIFVLPMATLYLSQHLLVTTVAGRSQQYQEAFFALHFSNTTILSFRTF